MVAFAFCGNGMDGSTTDGNGNRWTAFYWSVPATAAAFMEEEDDTIHNYNPVLPILAGVADMKSEERREKREERRKKKEERRKKKEEEGRRKKKEEEEKKKKKKKKEGVYSNSHLIYGRSQEEYGRR
jgi:ABC-type Zn2+ transport system substrate-binding protein/surface adhesin